MTLAALIVAAGRGQRAGGDMPKQWQPLAGRRVVDWTLDRFRLAGMDHIVLVLSPDDSEAWSEFSSTPDLIVVAGGDERAHSVRNGLEAMQGLGVQIVLIHDVARPCVNQTTIHLVQNALKTVPAAAPALPVSDALWIGQDDRVIGTQDRNGLYAAQTPQGFHYEAILAAHRAYPGSAADDVEVARAAGLDVTIVPGDPDNLKITRPEDFARAERILRTGMDIRLGNGFDVHAFGPGNHVTLCGVAVPHNQGLQGHSDADVGMHAITDAIYGALAQGDIGQHFPPSDPQWKGAASHIFLRHARDLAQGMGYRISNIDCTLICEFPKIGPHATAMRAALAGILDLDAVTISVKATTSEKLGFTGRGEGIAAMATAALVRP
jgi:2-C-methyl-D-erythritol 4-phosphate cytidylyltransferase / 2-C-methyl-D-erythritol 2,4-cyclodiphosphate synthase